MKLSTKLAIGAAAGLSAAVGLGLYVRTKKTPAEKLGYEIKDVKSFSHKETKFSTLTNILNGVKIEVESQSLKKPGTISYKYLPNGHIEITSEFSGLIGCEKEARTDIERIKDKVLEICNEKDTVEDIQTGLSKLAFTAFKKSKITVTK